MRGDQVEVFKILNGHENKDANIVFKIKTGKRTVGQNLKLVKGQEGRLDVRKHSFSQTTVNELNNLTADCVHSSRGNILFRKFHMRSVPVKLKLFNSCCSSLYTPHLWWNYKNMSVTKLQITYHNILKSNIRLSKYESTRATCTFTNTQ